MGGGASTVAPRSDDIVVKFSDIHSHLKIYQHKITGEVFFTLNDEELKKKLEDFEDWDEVVISNKQSAYNKESDLSIILDSLNKKKYGSSHQFLNNSNPNSNPSSSNIISTLSIQQVNREINSLNDSKVSIGSDKEYKYSGPLTGDNTSSHTFDQSSHTDLSGNQGYVTSSTKVINALKSPILNTSINPNSSYSINLANNSMSNNAILRNSSLVFSDAKAENNKTLLASSSTPYLSISNENGLIPASNNNSSLSFINPSSPSINNNNNNNLKTENKPYKYNRVLAEEDDDHSEDKNPPEKPKESIFLTLQRLREAAALSSDSHSSVFKNNNSISFSNDHSFMGEPTRVKGVYRKYESIYYRINHNTINTNNNNSYQEQPHHQYSSNERILIHQHFAKNNPVPIHEEFENEEVKDNYNNNFNDQLLFVKPGSLNILVDKVIIKCMICKKGFNGYNCREALADHEIFCRKISPIRNQLRNYDRDSQATINEFNHSYIGILKLAFYRSLLVGFDFLTIKHETNPSIDSIIYNCLSKAVDYIQVNLIIINEIYSIANKFQNMSCRRVNIDYIHDINRKFNDLISKFQINMGSIYHPYLLENILIESNYTKFPMFLQKLRDSILWKVGLLSDTRDYFPNLKHYNIRKLIGEGGFAKVFNVYGIYSHKQYAMKVISKSSLNSQIDINRLIQERFITNKMVSQTNFFVQFVSSFQDHSNLYMVMEYIPGGDCLSLLERIHKYPEICAQHIIVGVSMAVNHMHSLGFVHRDVKIDNVLITKYGHPKLCDFGLSARLELINTEDNKISHAKSFSSYEASMSNMSSEIQRNYPTNHISNSSNNSSILDFRFNNNKNILRGTVGNIYYSAPEIISGRFYDHTVDWWSIGILCYHMITGKTPFDGYNEKETRDNILDNKINWDNISSNISTECKSFIFQCLRPIPNFRLGYTDSSSVLDHAFFYDVNMDSYYKTPGPLVPLLIEDNVINEHDIENLINQPINPSIETQLDFSGINEVFNYYV